MSGRRAADVVLLDVAAEVGRARAILDLYDAGGDPGSAIGLRGCVDRIAAALAGRAQRHRGDDAGGPALGAFLAFALVLLMVGGVVAWLVAR